LIADLPYGENDPDEQIMHWPSRSRENHLKSSSTCVLTTDRNTDRKREKKNTVHDSSIHVDSRRTHRRFTLSFRYRFSAMGIPGACFRTWALASDCAASNTFRYDNIYSIIQVATVFHHHVSSTAVTNPWTFIIPFFPLKSYAKIPRVFWRRTLIVCYPIGRIFARLSLSKFGICRLNVVHLFAINGWMASSVNNDPSLR